MGKTFRGDGKNRAKKAAQRREQVRKGKRAKAICAALLAAFLAVFCGCSSAQSARFEQRKAIGVTSTNIGEWTVPVIAISEGPSATLFQSKGMSGIADIEGCASTTNHTTALGIYECDEVKHFQFKGTFTVMPTNSVPDKL